MFSVHIGKIVLQYRARIGRTADPLLIARYSSFSHQRDFVNRHTHLFRLGGVFFSLKRSFARWFLSVRIPLPLLPSYHVSMSERAEPYALPVVVVVGVMFPFPPLITAKCSVHRATHRAFALVSAIRGKCGFTLGCTFAWVASPHSLKVFPSANSAVASPSSRSPVTLMK